MTLSYIIGTMAVPTGFFTVLCIIYAVMDLTGRPAFLTRYKIQNNETVIVTCNLKQDVYMMVFCSV